MSITIAIFIPILQLFVTRQIMVAYYRLAPLSSYTITAFLLRRVNNSEACPNPTPSVWHSDQHTTETQVPCHPCREIARSPSQIVTDFHVGWSRASVSGVAWQSCERQCLPSDKDHPAIQRFIPGTCSDDDKFYDQHPLRCCWRVLVPSSPTGVCPCIVILLYLDTSYSRSSRIPLTEIIQDFEQFTVLNTTATTIESRSAEAFR